MWSSVLPNHRKEMKWLVRGGISFRNHRGDTACLASTSTKHHRPFVFVPLLKKVMTNMTTHANFVESFRFLCFFFVFKMLVALKTCPVLVPASSVKVH